MFFFPSLLGLEVHEAAPAQQTQSSGDRLSALHSRLQLEAEKIRKWKNATEVEIKQKVRVHIVSCDWC